MSVVKLYQVPEDNFDPMFLNVLREHADFKDMHDIDEVIVLYGTLDDLVEKYQEYNLELGDLLNQLDVHDSAYLMVTTV